MSELRTSLELASCTKNINSIPRRKSYLSPSAPQASHAGMDDDDTLSGTLFGGTSESTGFQLRIA